jgi:hypothetical protein
MEHGAEDKKEIIAQSWKLGKLLSFRSGLLTPNSLLIKRSTL